MREMQLSGPLAGIDDLRKTAMIGGRLNHGASFVHQQQMLRLLHALISE